MENFVHLHLHTECSLLDGASKIPEVISYVKKLGQRAVAITDHGNLYGVVDFYKEAVKNGIKPIIGCEVYTAPRGMSDKVYGVDSSYGHLVLLAENNTGYHNLVKIVSAANVDGFYYKPRVDFQLLEKYSQGLIALSACMSGDIPKAVLAGDSAKARSLIQRFIDIFGKDNFFIELQNQGIEGQDSLNAVLYEYSKEFGIGTVATNDAHYISRKDAEIQDILMCIQTGKTVSDKDRMKFETQEFYIKSEQEMTEALPGYKEAIYNTSRIAQRCSVTFDFNTTYLPVFETPDGEDSFEYLKSLCVSGIEKKYGQMTAELEERLAFELETIKSMGFCDYFLIVRDFVKYAKDKGIPVGPGRGSAAGSIVSYALDITTIDPVKYNLLFERFLNPERVTMPDIDIDFCGERRGEVIDYVTRKYGRDNVTQIITFGTMAARAAIRDVGRVLGIPISEVDRVAKLIPRELNITISSALKKDKELSAAYEAGGSIKKLIDVAMAVEGMKRHASTHAAGVVIYRSRADDYIPVQMQGEFITTQFPKETVEELGLLKIDFLGLRNLTIIQNTVESIEKSRGIRVDIENIDLDDPAIYASLGMGETDGLFQLESGGMRQFLRELKPDCFEDVIAAISLYRPGPMASIPTYVHNKNHPEDVKYKHELLKDILMPTYGCIVYQEQVMQIVQKLAGYSLGRADIVRRAMAKKKKDVLSRERDIFLYGGEGIDGCIKRGVDKETAEGIFDEILDFASYAFNKSHAAAYAVVACRTAWLKAKYPVEYMSALMTGFIDSSAKISRYIEDCKKKGIRLLPPDINTSFDSFTPDGKNIRFGLAAIKNVGRAAVQRIVSERETGGRFKNLHDFMNRVSGSEVNKKTIESLIKCGAFDYSGEKRSQLMKVVDLWSKDASAGARWQLAGQISLFDEDVMDYSLPDIPEYSRDELAQMEYELTGLYLTSNPLDDYRLSVKKSADTDISSIVGEDFSLEDGKTVTVAGIISNLRKSTTRKGANMAFLKLTDFTGAVEAVVFPKTYDKYASMLSNGKAVSVTGRISLQDEGGANIAVSSISLLNKIKFRENVRIVIKCTGEEMKSAASVIKNFYGGDSEVYIFNTDDGKWRVSKGENAVFCTDELIEGLKKCCSQAEVNEI